MHGESLLRSHSKICSRKAGLRALQIVIASRMTPVATLEVFHCAQRVSVGGGGALVAAVIVVVVAVPSPA